MGQAVQAELQVGFDCGDPLGGVHGGGHGPQQGGLAVSLASGDDPAEPGPDQRGQEGPYQGGVLGEIVEADVDEVVAADEHVRLGGHPRHREQAAAVGQLKVDPVPFRVETSLGQPDPATQIPDPLDQFVAAGGQLLLVGAPQPGQALLGPRRVALRQLVGDLLAQGGHDCLVDVTPGPLHTRVVEQLG